MTTLPASNLAAPEHTPIDEGDWTVGEPAFSLPGIFTLLVMGTASIFQTSETTNEVAGNLSFLL